MGQIESQGGKWRKGKAATQHFLDLDFTLSCSGHLTKLAAQVSASSKRMITRPRVLGGADSGAVWGGGRGYERERGRMGWEGGRGGVEGKG